MSKEVKLGAVLAGLVVVATGVYLKYGRTPENGDVRIESTSERAEKAGSGADSKEPGRLADLSHRSGAVKAPQSPPHPSGVGESSSKNADPSTTPSASEKSLAGTDDLDNQAPQSPPGEAPATGAPSLKDLRLASETASPATAADSKPDSAGSTGVGAAAIVQAPPSSTAPDAATPVTEGAGAAPAMEYYQVQPGDTFGRIARMYYGNERHAEFLRTSNADILGGNALRDGVRIRIPALPAPGAKPSLAASAKPNGADGRPRDEAPLRSVVSSGKPMTGQKPEAMSKPGGRTYTVKAGETFYAIAKRELGSASRWKELLALNQQLVDGEPKNLRAGHVLKLPNS